MTDRLNQFLSDENNFEAIAYNDPRAVAHRAKVAANARRRASAQTRETAKAAEKASTFEVGQPVLGARGLRGTIISIDREFVVLNVNGAHRTFHAAALRAA